jgi:hypothetical protein
VGQLSFSTAEIAELRRLLVELRRADRDRQKAIRAKIRRVGFNISDVSHDAGGFTATDFDVLISRGVITERNESDVAEPRTRPSCATDDSAESVAEGSMSVIPTLWTKSGLEVDGFAPWVTFADLEAALPSIPVGAAGVYVVHRGPMADPDWLVPSPVGDTWRGDPTVSAEVLRANWVPVRQSSTSGKPSNASFGIDFEPTFGSDRAGVVDTGAGV